MQGKGRGEDAAALDAAGAGLGGVALAVFGVVMWFIASDTAPGSLALATIAWFVVAILLGVCGAQCAFTEREARDPRFPFLPFVCRI